MRRAAPRLVPRALAAAAALLLACAAPPETSAPPPRVVVEVYRGLPAPPDWAKAERPGPFHLVLDATSSMRALAAPEAPGVRRLDAARVAAQRALRGLPAGRDVTAHVLGAAAGGACPGPVPLRAGPGQRAAETLGPALRTLAPRSEGSLGTALAEVARSLRAEGEAGRRGAEVVVVSDLERGCGPDPCAAAAELAALGAGIEIVAIGGRSVPACLAEPELPDGPPPALAESLAPPEPAPRVRVEQRNEEGAQVATANGRADGSTLVAKPGEALVAVGLEPVEWIGPVELASGTLLRIRILAFEQADPPVRAVWTQRSSASAAAEPASASRTAR